MNIIGPVFLKQADAIVKGGESGRLVAGLERRKGVGVEGQRDDAVARSGEFAAALEECGVPEVYAVERPYGQD